jgi:hypothetical protein
MKKLLLLIVLYLGSFSSNAQSWTPLPGGSLDGQPMSMVSFGGYRWFSGSFYHAGSLYTEFVVRHDGSGWVATPYLARPAHGFCVWNNTLYAVGSFEIGSITYGVAKWNGVSWDYFGVIQNGYYFHTAIVFNNELVFGGRALSVDGVPINHLAKWNGTNWSSFPFTITCSWSALPEIDALEEYSGFLYIGGAFDQINSTFSSLVFRTNGVSIDQMSLGSNYGVADFAIYHDSLFCTGSFPFGPFPANQGSPGIVKTDNTAWSQVGHGLKLRGSSMATYLTDLYVGGSYSGGCFNIPCDHADVGNLGKWNGSLWSNESGGLFNQGNEGISLLYTDINSNTLYTIGDFHTNRGDVADFIAKKQISVVPVHLSSFTAQVVAGGSVKLDWRDETPEDGVKFDVQMSTDGQSFKSIGQAIGKTNKNDYSFVFPNKSCGKLYFRLAFEGKYSEIKMINIACDVSIISDGKTLRIQTKYPGKLSIMNSSGQVLSRSSVTSGYTQVTSSLSTGVYVASFVDHKGNTFVQKVFIDN